MRLSGRLSLVFCGALLTMSSGARAGNSDGSGAGAGAAQPPPTRARVGVMFVLEPLGRLRSNSGAFEERVGGELAYAVMTTFDFVPHPNVFVGLAPAYTFNIKARGSAAEPARDFDLLVRFGMAFPIGERFRAYGYLAPGYSFVSGLPGGTTAQGPLMGVHGGGQLTLTPVIFLSGEFGYQAGFQRASVDQGEIPFESSFFQIGLGAGASL